MTSLGEGLDALAELQRREEILRVARERRDAARKRYEDHAEQMLAAEGVFNPSYEQIRAKVEEIHAENRRRAVKLDEEACFLKPLVRRYKGVKYPDSPSPTTSDEDIRASLSRDSH